MILLIENATMCCTVSTYVMARVEDDRVSSEFLLHDSGFLEIGFTPVRQLAFLLCTQRKKMDRPPGEARKWFV